MDSKDKTPESISNELNEQTGVVAWSELVKHFARGVLITIDPDLDLVNVAHSMSVDNTSQMQQWLDNGTVRRASDEDAREWNKENPEFWCMVVAPWVIVQKKGTAKELH